jgi:translation initiation factor IF-2
MSSVRLSKATKELNISLDRAVEELAKHGHEIPNNRNHKITDEQYEVLMTAFADDLARKKRSEAVSAQVKEEKDLLRGGADEAPSPSPAPVAEEVPAPAPTPEPVKEEAPAPKAEEAPKEETKGPKVLGKIDLEVAKPKKKEAPKAEPKAKEARRL